MMNYKKIGKTLGYSVLSCAEIVGACFSTAIGTAVVVNNAQSYRNADKAERKNLRKGIVIGALGLIGGIATAIQLPNTKKAIDCSLGLDEVGQSFRVEFPDTGDDDDPLSGMKIDINEETEEADC